MGFLSAVKTCFRKYATFSGRASRSEYWWFMALYYVLAIGLMILWEVKSQGLITTDQGRILGMGLYLAAAVGAFALLIPFLAVSVRRFHDRNAPGGAFLAALVLSNVPYISTFATIGLIIFCAAPGTRGPNRFGPDPLAPHGDAAVFS